MNRTHLLSAALMAFPCLAIAQTAPTVNATLSFSTTSVPLNTTTTRQNAVNLVSDIVISDAFSLGFDVDYGQIAQNQSNLNADLTRLQLEPTLHLSNGIYLGAYVQRATTAISILSVSLDSRGAFAGYDAGAWAVEGYFGTTTADVSLGNNPIPSMKNNGLTVTLRPMEHLELFAHVANSDLQNAVGSINLRAFGGQYDLNNGVMVYAVKQSMHLGPDGPSVDQIALGAGFDLSQLNSNLVGTITLEVAPLSSNGNSITDRITTISWIMPIGKAKATPLSSIARTARGGIRGAFVAGAGSMSLLSSLSNVTG